jgi:hypothetical protein
MRRLRGQTWQVEEMLKIFLVILVFGGAVLLILAGTGGLTNILHDFCEKNPKWCGQPPGEEDYETARTSVSALICAINSIIKGEEWKSSDCIKFYKSTPEQAETASPNTEEENTDNDGFDWGFPWDPTGVVIGKEVRDFMTGLAVGEDEKKDTEIQCKQESGSFKCDVINFKLPQDIGDAEEWIEGFGDPRFLVFYRQFPAGEERAWSGFSEWFKSSGTLIFGSLCLSKLLYYGAYTFAAPIKAGKKIGELVVEVPKMGYRGIAKLGKTIPSGAKQAYYVGKDVVQSASRREMLDKIYTYSGVVALEKADKWWQVFKRIAPKTAVYTGQASGVAGFAAYVDARFHTEFGKYIPEEGVMLLQEAANKDPLLEEKLDLGGKSKVAYTDPFEENIVSIAKPILLKKTEGSSSFKPFYLASPCRSDIKVFTEKDVYCGEYSLDSNKGSVYCDSPEEMGVINYKFNIKPCGSVGVFGTHFEKDFGNNISDLVTNKMQKEIIFEDSNNDGKNDIVKEPIFGFSFEVETDYSKIKCCSYDLDDDPKTENITGWMVGEMCIEIGGIVANDDECLSKSVIIKGKPIALITRVTDPLSKHWRPNIENTAPWECHKVLATSEQASWGDILIFGMNNELLRCSTKGIIDSLFKQGDEYEKVFRRDGLLYGFLSHSELEDIELLGSFEENGNLKNIDNILIRTGLEQLSETSKSIEDYILLSDFNSDGKLDGIKTHALHSWRKNEEDILKTIPTRAFVDSDFDGNVDMISSTYCKTDVITIVPEKGKYTEEEHNFCYTEERKWVGIASTVAGFALDVFVKKIPSPITWALGTAADCYLMYKTADWETGDWPG